MNTPQSKAVCEATHKGLDTRLVAIERAVTALDRKFTAWDTVLFVAAITVIGAFVTVIATAAVSAGG